MRPSAPITLVLLVSGFAVGVLLVSLSVLREEPAGTGGRYRPDVAGSRAVSAPGGPPAERAREAGAHASASVDHTAPGQGPSAKLASRPGVAPNERARPAVPEASRRPVERPTREVERTRHELDGTTSGETERAAPDGAALPHPSGGGARSVPGAPTAAEAPAADAEAGDSTPHDSETGDLALQTTLVGLEADAARAAERLGLVDPALLEFRVEQRVPEGSVPPGRLDEARAQARRQILADAAVAESLARARNDTVWDPAPRGWAQTLAPAADPAQRADQLERATRSLSR